MRVVNVPSLSPEEREAALDRFLAFVFVLIVLVVFGLGFALRAWIGC